MFVRPTPLALAFMNAAWKATNNATLPANDRPLAAKVLTLAISDNPKRPMSSGYNRTEIDGIRVSDTTARAIGASIRI